MQCEARICQCVSVWIACLLSVTVLELFAYWFPQFVVYWVRIMAAPQIRAAVPEIRAAVVEWYNHRMVVQISYFANFVWFPGVYRGQMGVWIIASTPASTRANSVSEMEVFHCRGGMPSRFLPRDDGRRVGLVREVYPNLEYPANLHDFMRSLRIADYWDGMCGYSLHHSTTLEGVTYHACDFYCRSASERMMFGDLFGWYALLDVLEPRYWFLSASFRGVGYRRMDWMNAAPGILARL